MVRRSSSEEVLLVPGVKGPRLLADEVLARWVWDSLTLLYWPDLVGVWEPSAPVGRVLLLGADMVLGAVRRAR